MLDGIPSAHVVFGLGDLGRTKLPSSECISVLYIAPTNTSSTLQLIMKGIQQKLQKSCFTWHIESKYMLQPPEYLIIILNRFRYIDNIVTKDRRSIPTDMTIVLSPHKFSLQAAIYHHGLSVYSDHYATTLSIVAKNILSQKTAKLWSLK